MDKYDYITATIEDEKIRLEKILTYLKESDSLSSEFLEYQERYNNICLYLNAKAKYLDAVKIIKESEQKLSNLEKSKDEYELDNILIEDSLLGKFHLDTHNAYRNTTYEDIKLLTGNIKDILLLLYEKENNYQELVVKRNRLKELIDRTEFPNTYDTLLNQEIIIEKEGSLYDEIYMIENNIRMAQSKIQKLEDSVMTDSILKILYEFWIIDSYDPKRVDKSNLFKDNRTLVSFKNTISLQENNENDLSIEEFEKEKIDMDYQELKVPDLKLPNVDENTLININGKNYVNSEDNG